MKGRSTAQILLLIGFLIVLLPVARLIWDTPMSGNVPRWDETVRVGEAWRVLRALLWIERTWRLDG